MSKSKKNEKIEKSTIRVKKTRRLDQRKLKSIARRYGISPMSVRELQLGYPEEILRAAAERLIKAGYVTRVQSKLREQQIRVDTLTTEDKEPVTTSDDIDTKTISVPKNETGDLQDEEEQI